MTFHFIITLAIPGGMASYDGTHTPRPGETRMDAYREICDLARKKAAFNGPVVFFSLEPNDLDAGVAR